jgi:hypothetical protein
VYLSLNVIVLNKIIEYKKIKANNIFLRTNSTQTIGIFILKNNNFNVILPK